MTESSGTSLYSRVSTFAECDKINPTADVRPSVIRRRRTCARYRGSTWGG